MCCPSVDRHGTNITTGDIVAGKLSPISSNGHFCAFSLSGEGGSSRGGRREKALNMTTALNGYAIADI